MKKEQDFLNNILKKDDVVVVALSGGPDSMCLFSLLLKIKGIKLIAAHVNHNLREESAQEAVFVEKYCVDNGALFESMIIKEYHDDNFHNDARNIRYKFFEKIIKKYKANYLMTAHHGDDLMETILMRIVRGSSLTGYAGFKQIVNKGKYKIVRPLITTTKKDIMDYNELNNVPFAIDKSNEKDKYTRNRYRKYVLAFLKSEDSTVHKKFLKYSETLRNYDNYINKIVKKELKKVYKNKSIIVEKFVKLDNLIQTKIIEYILETIYHDDLIMISDVHTESIINLISSNKCSGNIDFPNNILIRKSYGLITFKHNNIVNNYTIKLNNKTILPNNKIIEVIDFSEEKSNYVTRFSYDDIKLPIIIRNRHNGDKMQVKRMTGSKKISDIFIDSKIDLEERKLWPIVTDSAGKILWIPGIKKSKFDKEKNEKYDIILKYI